MCYCRAIDCSPARAGVLMRCLRAVLQPNYILLGWITAAWSASGFCCHRLNQCLASISSSQCFVGARTRLSCWISSATDVIAGRSRKADPSCLYSTGSMISRRRRSGRSKQHFPLSPYTHSCHNLLWLVWFSCHLSSTNAQQTLNRRSTDAQQTVACLSRRRNNALETS